MNGDEYWSGDEVLPHVPVPFRFRDVPDERCGWCDEPWSLHDEAMKDAHSASEAAFDRREYGAA